MTRPSSRSKAFAAGGWRWAIGAVPPGAALADHRRLRRPQRLPGASVAAASAKACRRAAACHSGLPLPARCQQAKQDEHRMFCDITVIVNWRGRPLLSRQVVVNLIGLEASPAGRACAFRSDSMKALTRQGSRYQRKNSPVWQSRALNFTASGTTGYCPALRLSQHKCSSYLC